MTTPSPSAWAFSSVPFAPFSAPSAAGLDSAFSGALVVEEVGAPPLFAVAAAIFARVERGKRWKLEGASAVMVGELMEAGKEKEGECEEAAKGEGYVEAGARAGCLSHSLT